MVGADPDELVRISAGFVRAADDLHRVESTTDAHISRVRWNGRDLDEFRSRWTRTHRPDLRRSIESLERAARELRAQADEQRRASKAGGEFAQVGGIAALLGHGWADVTGGVRSGLDLIGQATGDLLVSVGSLLGSGTVALEHAAAELGEHVVDGAGRVFDDVVKPGLERDLLEVYDWAAALPLMGELVEQTSGVVPADPLVGGVGQGLDVSQIYDNLAANYGGPGHIEVQTVQGADGQLRYVVYIPGTQEWLPGSNNPADIMSDVEVGGFYDDTPLSIAVERAIKAAGVPDGAQLVLAGHSLGGLTAVQMSRDTDFTSHYQVEGVFTAGAGTDLTKPPAGVQFQALRHYNDAVSWLGDSEPVFTGGPGQQEHWSWGPSVWSPLDNHNMPGYQADAHRLQDSGAFDATENSLAGFFDTGSTVVNSQGFEARKLPFIGDDPRISSTPVSSGGKAA